MACEYKASNTNSQVPTLAFSRRGVLTNRVGAKGEPLAPQNQNALGRQGSIISYGRQFILEMENSGHKPGLMLSITLGWEA
jgi:hypothetical protein